MLLVSHKLSGEYLAVSKHENKFQKQLDLHAFENPVKKKVSRGERPEGPAGPKLLESGMNS